MSADRATPIGAGRLATGWAPTGRQRHVATWFGLAKIWIEEKRMVYRARGATPQPAYWTPQLRWRRAGRRDRPDIVNVVTFNTAAEART